MSITRLAARRLQQPQHRFLYFSFLTIFLVSSRLASITALKDIGLPLADGQRAGSGVTLTNMFGRRFKVSTVIFEIKPFTLSGSA